MRNPWGDGPVLDHRTPFSALDAIAERYAVAAMDDLREQLNADDCLTFAERSELLLKAWPLIRATTRAEIEKGWVNCKLSMQEVQ